MDKNGRARFLLGSVHRRDMTKHSVNGHRTAGDDLALNGASLHDGIDGIEPPALTDRQRQRLLAIATRMKFPARTIVYREGDPGSWLYVNVDGMLKAYRELPSGKRRGLAFLFPKDVFGLAENGRYVNTTKTITATTLYRIPYDELRAMLRHDAALSFLFLCKVTHKLREAQRQVIAIGRRDAAGRVLMFLSMLERHLPPSTRGGDLDVPMSRSDIAEYLGLSLEALSRATSKLATQGILTFRGRHVAHVQDRSRFDSLVGAL
jgi:CRP-like cAMP-binding protein